MPEHWDEDDDGVWKPPTIPNPEHKGQWRRKKIKNPNYKGKWRTPYIDNPEFEDDPGLYVMKPIKYVGIEVWQVKGGSIFDNVVEDVFASRESETRVLQTKSFNLIEREMSKSKLSSFDIRRPKRIRLKRQRKLEELERKRNLEEHGRKVKEGKEEKRKRGRSKKPQGPLQRKVQKGMYSNLNIVKVTKQPVKML